MDALWPFWRDSFPLLILSTDLKSSSWQHPLPPQTSERRVLAGKAATIGREVGVNSELEPEEPEPGGGFEFSRGGSSREET